MSRVTSASPASGAVQDVVDHSSDLQACFAGYSALRAELSSWLTQNVRTDGPGPNGGGEDEANYALAWFGHYLVTREPAIADRFRELAALAAWVETRCFHGYEPEAEAHHGTELFILFLPPYLPLFPQDRTALRPLLDAAEHVGNWCANVPASKRAASSGQQDLIARATVDSYGDYVRKCHGAPTTAPRSLRSDQLKFVSPLVSQHVGEHVQDGSVFARLKFGVAFVNQ